MNMPHGPVGGGGMMGGQSSGIMAGGCVIGGGMSRMRSTSVERGFRSRSPIRLSVFCVFLDLSLSIDNFC